MDRRELAEFCRLSLPTIQRMETSQDIVRGNVNSLLKLVATLDAADLELIGPGDDKRGRWAPGLRFCKAPPRPLRYPELKATIV